MQRNRAGEQGKRKWISLAGCAAAALMAAAPGGALAAPTETVLHSFAGSPSDGANPEAGLIADGSGNLYGTTEVGGVHNAGAVLKLAPSGTETVLYSFCSKPSCRDGKVPLAGLIADSAGNLYGTTFFGGAAGNGTVFKLTPSGTETVLYSFAGGSSDGANPSAGLIADGSGNLYGTTVFGGAAGAGVVFKLTPSRTVTVLHSFARGGSHGTGPRAGLIADSSGNLYGTTEFGGALNFGVVFKLTPSGTETVLHSFAGGTSDGAVPIAGLIGDSAGNLYGTTLGHGAAGVGVVFKLTPSGTETVLHSFAGSDGSEPAAGLIADGSGNLYGTTSIGGASGFGVVFKLTPSGTETVLYSFAGGTSDGAQPFAGLIADGSGNLYGTTCMGGASGQGVVFKLAGTGFVATPISFAAFSGTLAIDVDPSPNTDTFKLNASFTLGTKSPGINPPAEPVTLKIGTFSTTIPPGSFTGSGVGPFTFLGTINGVALQVTITLRNTVARRYSFHAAASSASLTGTVNPVPVTLTIGDDTGTVSITAQILP